jgi:NAD(P)-dependent dehydrogenase (short-subunit alcohol dehydrogenase family)
MTEPIEVSQVAEALIAGIETRAPRIIEPPAWRPPFKWRGLVGPVSDLRIERNAKVGETVREIETPEGDGHWVAAGPAPLDYNLAGKVVFVTGGAQGIGQEIGRMAYGRGASVVLVDLDLEHSRQAAAGLGERALGLAADVTDRDSIEQAIADAKERFGRVDVVVANAGITTRIATMRSLPAADWERVMEVNLFGVWRTVRAGMEEVLANRGQFVLVASSYAFSNGVLNSAYAAAKSGVEALGRALRSELRPLGASAAVAYFGFIKTEMVRTSFEDPFVDRFRNEVLPEFLTRQVPVSQAGAVVIDAIESRGPRAIAPLEWKGLFYARGLTSPLMDSQFDNDETLREIILGAEQAEFDRRAGDSSLPG